MKHTIGTVVAAATCSLALAGCGGGDASAPASAAPPPPSASASSAAPASAPVTPSVAPTSKEERDKVFVADVRSKVASGDYTPTEGSTEKAQKNIETYLAALPDERLAAAGEYNCQIRQEVTKAGQTDFGRRDFEKLMLKNTGLEAGFAPVLGLTWDEAVKTICPG